MQNTSFNYQFDKQGGKYSYKQENEEDRNEDDNFSLHISQEMYFPITEVNKIQKYGRIN